MTYRPPWELLEGADLLEVDRQCAETDRFTLQPWGAGPNPFERMQFLVGTEQLVMDMAYGESMIFHSDGYIIDVILFGTEDDVRQAVRRASRSFFRNGPTGVIPALGRIKRDPIRNFLRFSTNGTVYSMTTERSDSVAKQPNIIICTADQLRWSALGCYGNEYVRTPNLDRLAARGIKFETATTNAPVCMAVRI